MGGMNGDGEGEAGFRGKHGSDNIESGSGLFPRS